MERCPRCGSMMEHITFYGKGESFKGHRCYACGEIFDKLILQNRAFSPKPRPTGGIEKGTPIYPHARERMIKGLSGE